MGRAYSTQGEKMNAYRILVGKPEEKILLGILKHRWEDNIKIDFKGIRWDGMDGINLDLRNRSTLDIGVLGYIGIF
jgi:hypothetical protein